MLEKQIEIQVGQTLTLLEMAADVAIRGGDEARVVVRMQDGEEEDVVVTLDEAGPAITARRACEVHVPSAVAVVVRQARGNLKAKELSSLNVEEVRGSLKLGKVQNAVLAEVYGSLKVKEVESLRVVGTVHGDASLSEVPAADVQTVRGNLRAKEMATLRVARIGGNLEAKEVSGTVAAGQVGGNALLREIGGLVSLDQVAGNLIGKELTGGAKVGRIGGNLVLSGELRTGCTYHFSSDGNAVVRLEEDASVHVTITARGHILSSLALADEQRTDRTLVGSLGGGGPELAIETQGNAILGSHTDDGAHGIDPGITQRVEEGLRSIDLEGVGRQVSQEMEAAMSRLRVKMETMDWERLGSRAQDAVERSMERMQRDVDLWANKMGRRQESLAHQAERAAHRAEREAQRAGRDARRSERWEQRLRAGAAAASTTDAMDDEEGRPDGTQPAPEPRTSLDQERLAILKMVEQSQISPEEAGMLLDALEK